MFSQCEKNVSVAVSHAAQEHTSFPQFLQLPLLHLGTLACLTIKDISNCYLMSEICIVIKNSKRIDRFSE